MVSIYCLWTLIIDQFHSINHQNYHSQFILIPFLPSSLHHLLLEFNVLSNLDKKYKLIRGNCRPYQTNIIIMPNCKIHLIYSLKMFYLEPLAAHLSNYQSVHNFKAVPLRCCNLTTASRSRVCQSSQVRQRRLWLLVLLRFVCVRAVFDIVWNGRVTQSSVYYYQASGWQAGWSLERMSLVPLPVNDTLRFHNERCFPSNCAEELRNTNFGRVGTSLNKVYYQVEMEKIIVSL